MKRIMVLSVLCAMLVLSGCVTSTYYGQVDASVPMAEQCLLKIDTSTISVYSFDGQEVDWHRILIYDADSVSIPAGQHRFVCIVSHNRYDGGVDMYRATVSYDFKPGYTYWMVEYGSGVSISVEEVGEPRSVVVAPEIQVVGMGMPFRSIGTGWGIVYPLQIGAVIDSDIVTTGLYWDFGLGLGAPIDLNNSYEVGLTAYTGVSSEFYLPGGSFGLGLGAGIASPDAFMGSLSPYVRATVIPFKRITKLKIHFDYYFPGVKYSSIEYPTSTWGLGVTWFW
jgi:hypothetical protein